MRNCKFLFQDDPDQKENFNIEISFKVRTNIKSNKLDLDGIKDFIDHIASIKDQAHNYDKEVDHE